MDKKVYINNKNLEKLYVRTNKDNNSMIQKHNGLEIWNVFFREVPGNMVQMDLVKQTVKAEFEKAFLELFQITKKMNADEIFKIYTTIFENMFMQHANNVACFTKVKLSDENEFKKTVERHVNRFKKTYNFHIEKFKCNQGITVAENIDLTAEINNWFDNFNNKINDFMKLSKDLTLDQSKELHDIMVEAIINTHVEKIPCFKKLKTDSVDGMNLSDIIVNHQKRCNRVLNMHVNMFDCK